MIRKARYIAIAIACIISSSWYITTSVNAASILNMDAHDISAGATMYYWDSTNGNGGFSASIGSRFGLEQEFSNDDANVDGGYRDMSDSKDVVVASSSGVTSYSFNKIAPKTSTYKLFTRNNGYNKLVVRSGNISYGF